MSNPFELLRRRGWAMFRTGPSPKRILALAEELGIPIAPPNRPALHCLPARPENTAAVNTYSGRFGMGEFPLHTDMANWTTPPRYVLLRRKSPDASVPTLVADPVIPLQSVDLAQLKKGIWVGRAARRSFVCNLLAMKNGHHLFRWDPVTLKPLTDDARNVQAELEAILRKGKVTPIDYDDETTVVLDNWRILHARPRVLIEQRVMERVLVMERRR